MKTFITGGLKTWECALDLVEFLSKNINNLDFEGKKILEVDFILF